MSEPKLIIDDPFLGEREIEPGYAGMIKDQLKLLNYFKNDGRTPAKGLLDDIKVYEYILNHEQSEKMADLYFKETERLREETKSFKIPKMKIAKNLGWDILNG